MPLASLRDAHIWRISVPPSESAVVMARIRSTVETRYYCDWGGGLLWLAVPPDPEAHGQVIRGAISSGSGHATLIRAPANVRRSVPVFQPQPKALAELTRRVKTSFDPERVLNRSRMYEGV
jgi:glycolate oxidase FAD binding subunit